MGPTGTLGGRRRWLAGLALVWLAATVLAVGVGAVDVPPARILRLALAVLLGRGAPAGEDPEAVIVVQIRLPRVLLANLVGAALAIAGAAFQGMFRNPMADPYVVGVSSGAALGAVLALLLSLRLDFLGLGAVPVLAFGTAVATTALVYALARVDGRVPVAGLLLAGIAVASFMGAMVGLVVYLSGERLRPVVFWLLGSLAGASWADVLVLLPYLLLGLAVLGWHARALNALLLGEEQAHYLGVDVERAKRWVVAAGALLTAAAVSVSGTIGFVGLLVPHAVRLLAGPDHRLLIPATALGGGLLLVACDAVARTALAPAELPVGIVTALLGGPFFLWVLRRRARAWHSL